MLTVTISNGQVQGKIKNVLLRDIAEFLSIPYCKPPIGDLRFQKPQPFNSFNKEIINCLKFATCPPQLPIQIFNGQNSDEETWIPQEKQDENCLYANIWCPLEILRGEEDRPVMVWIYGGGFVSGSSSLEIYDGSVLASKENIVVVSFNYRIAMLGFMNLDDEFINGNIGIWDQICALQWIHENISNFKGNPNNITIIGNSAGGCSVSLHLLIEQSWRYFQNAIMLSGVCFSDWGFLPKKEIRARSIKAVNKILKKFDFPTKWDENITRENKKSIITFLQGIDFKEFLIDSELIAGITQFAWTPCVDGELIQDDPRRLFNEKKFKKCPTVFLNVANEGNYFIISRFPQIKVDNQRLIDIKYFNDSFQYYPHFPINCSDSTKKNVSIEYELNKKSLSIDILDKIIGDQYFVSGSIELANSIGRSNSQVYYLWFETYEPPKQWPEWCGVMHSEEIYYLFGNYLIQPLNEVTTITTLKLMKEFGHFLYHGNFSEEFANYDEVSNAYIKINKDNWSCSMFTKDQINKAKFWKKLRENILQ